MKNFKFAITDNTVYEGKDLIDFYSKALLEGATKSTFRVIPGVKSKIKVPRYDAGQIIKDASCDWDSSGEGTLSQKEMEVCHKDIQIELCSDTFSSNFLGEYLRNGHNTGEVAPAVFTDYMINEIGKKVQNDLELAVWQGNKTGSTYPENICDGLLKKLEENVNVLNVTGTTLNLSNIIAEVSKVYEAIPATVINNPELMIYVSDNIYRLYQQAIAAASNESFYVSKKEPNFLGIPLHWSPGMPANQMVACVSKNLVLLTDLLSDEEELSIIPQRNTRGVRTVRIVGGFKFGVDFSVGAEVVVYG